MAHHDETLIDKVKHALGMGHDHDDAADNDEVTATGAATADPDADSLDDDRADGWAGVPEALYDDTSATHRTRESGYATGASDRGEATDAYAPDEPSGLGRNPGPVGSARYEDGAGPGDLGDTDAEGGFDATREDAAATEYGAAYGEDDTPMPTSAAWDRGEAAPEEPEFGSDDDIRRRETGI